MSGSKIFLFSCILFIIGIFFGVIIQDAQMIVLGFLFLISFISCLIFRKLKWLIIFCLIFFIFGFLRTDFFKMEIVNNQLQNFNEQEVILQGIVVKEPEITQKNQKLIIKVEEIDMGPTHVNSEERVLVYAPLYPEYQYGEGLQIKGILEEPPVLDDFDYKQYLARKKIYSIMFSPKIDVLPVERKVGFMSWVYKKILKGKLELGAGIEQNFPSSQSALLKAIILGNKTGLTDELKETLNKAGIRHLTAISGMHVTILINLLMLVFLGLGLWRKQAFWLTIVFILFFVVMTGLQSSTIRASIMGFLFLLGQHFGRTGDSLRAIIFGAVLMLVFNPFLLSDAGFQLSFLAVLGINYLFPIFSNWLRKIPNIFQIKSILAMSLSAQVFTLPILIYSFGRISLVAPLTNILVLPFLPFIIILGFLSAFFGIFSHFLALIFVFPCWLLLSYLLKIAEAFSCFAFSSIHLKISWLWLIIFYLVLGFLIWHWKKEHRFKILGF
jgi:competence protein ComEC